MNTKKITLPNEILYAINILKTNGFKAYVVGGAVRDFVLRREVSDFDITTDALPCDIHTIFEKCIDTGISHGTVTVIINHIHIEVTTFRSDGIYTDHRRPDNVSFSKRLEDDLSRRDFTINALAYSPDEGITDLFNGINDIKNKTLRCVGNAKKRFDEDALRMLRLIRFCTKLGFDETKETLEALKVKEHLIRFVSKERIREELIKIILSDYPEKLMNFEECKIFDIIFEADFFEKITQSKIIHLKALKKSHILRLSYILFEIFSCDLDKTRGFLSSLKFSNIEKNSVLKILEFLKEYFNRDVELNSDFQLKKSIRKYDKENILFAFDIISVFKDASVLKSNFERIEKNNEPYLFSHLKINGKDLTSIGFKGKETGMCLEILLDKVTHNPEFNTKENLMKEAEKIYASKSLCQN